MLWQPVAPATQLQKHGIEPAVVAILPAVGVVELEAGELRVRLKQAKAGVDRRHLRLTR